MVRQEPTQTHQPQRMKTFRLAAWAAHWTGRMNPAAAATVPLASIPATSTPALADDDADVKGDPGPTAPMGPTSEPPAQPLELAEKRVQFWSYATHDLCQPAQALALFLERLKRLPMDPQAAPI